MAKMEFGKDELNWLHGDEAPSEADLERMEDGDPEEDQ